jgi:myosin heavy subunit
VLDVTRSLYLLNQTHNEILLRVGIELVTSKSARKIFQWTDGEWYDDDSRREWFRDVVQSQVTHVLETCSGEKKDDEKLAAANAKMKEAKAELSLALQKCEAAEAMVEQTRCRVRNLERALDVKSEELLQTQEDLEEAQVQLKAAREKVSVSEAKLRDSKKMAASVEAQLRDTDARCLGLEEDLAKHKAELDALRIDFKSRNKEIGNLRSETDSILRKSDSEAISHAEKLKASSETAQQAEKKAMKEIHRQSVELQSWVAAAETAQAQAAELRQVVDQLQEQVASLEAEKSSTENTGGHIAELEEALTDMKSRLTSLDVENDALRCQLEAALGPSTCQGIPDDKSVSSQPSKANLTSDIVCGEAGVQTEREKAQLFPASLATAAPALKLSLEDTKRALKRLESENKELKVTLDGLQAKLKCVIDSCHETSVASQLSDVISNVGLKQMKFGVVWDRLYGDAMERIDRMDKRPVHAQPPTMSPESENSFVEEREHSCTSKALANVSGHSDAHHRIMLTPDVSNNVFCSRPDTSPRSVSFHATAMGGWPQKALSLPPCTAARRLPKFVSSNHLRSARHSSRGKRATSSTTFNYGGEDSRSCTPSPQRKRPSTSVSLPFLHGHRLRTSSDDKNFLPERF